MAWRASAGALRRVMHGVLLGERDVVDRAHAEGVLRSSPVWVVRSGAPVGLTDAHAQSLAVGGLA